MKKVLSIALLVVLLITLATTVKAATPAEDLYNYMSGTFTIAGKQVKLFTDLELGQVRQYLDTHTIDKDQYLHIQDQIKSTVEVMNEAGVTSIYDLKGEDLEFVKLNIKGAASALGLTVKYDAQNGKALVIDAEGTVVGDIPVGTNRGNQVQTDIVNYTYLAIPVVAIIAIAMVAVHKKANA